ncbi:hypothetical protein DXG03_000265 [Asterophora parasitica]|uniref:Uncharacterized protein n=1 Tax=Asterophora parasitica TaxID=117018 RepID=A0A9P7KIP7_9AGAR|nr:hypothetical protein DXG03_000265 [Asterophora parasitica]
MKRRRTDDNAADVEPTSSLPSPPISSPTPLPAAFAEEGQAQTFASLGKDSPIEDPLEVQDEYFDLTLESMITREIDRKIAPSTYSPPAAQQFPTPSAQDPQLSPSSSFGSQNSVEKQLTQSLNLDEAQEDLKYTPSQPRHIHDVPFNGVLGDRTPVQATPGLVRQAWYTNQSSHSKRYTIHSQSSSDSSSQPTSSPPNSRQETLTEARAKPVYSGSGTIQYSPSPAGQPYSQSHIYSMAFSQSGTQDSELGLSYPPQLQTQAPYQSQSFSQ